MTLVGRAGCHLCEAARAVVAEVCADAGVSWCEVDLDADPSAERRERWSDMVPVVLVDGRQHTYWRVDAARLRLALQDPPGRRRWWR